jgi:type IV secretory pathway TraG/TraD family ATPase VirD4
MKGELFAATAGYRKQLGKVFVIDPQGYRHRFDPLHGKQTEDEFYSSASSAEPRQHATQATCLPYQSTCDTPH